jgi:hypothetical protein
MGITQQIGASSIIKPGVIDNTAARPASPYEGQVIFQKDTDQLLVWNGTAWRPIGAILPGCSVTRTTNQSIANASYNSISWDSELFDTDTMFAPTTTDITIKTAGLYLLTLLVTELP